MKRLSIQTDAPAIYNIIVICVLLFAATYIAAFQNYNLTELLGMHYVFSKGFYPWQIITHMFMHGGFTHILFNLMSLYSLGVILERLWGSKRFMYFYMICGIGAAVLHQLAQMVMFYKITGQFSMDNLMLTSMQIKELQGFGGIAVGASGAIFGVFAAFALLFPNHELMLLLIPVPLKAKYVIGGMILLDLYMGFTGSSLFGYGQNIAHFAHIGGAITGFIIVQIWKRDRNNFY